MHKSPAQLDHVVLLLPHADVLNPPDWITSRFTVSAGGKHAEGKTENRLIMFRDGTYLELIAFVKDDPAKREGHWWDKAFGIVDFALTTRMEFDYAALQERLRKSGSVVSYAEPVEGGRVTPDRQELRWKVTFPKGVERGVVPFWCHDLTPRERRVPAFDGNTHHPCGAVGMAGLFVDVAEDQFERVKAALPAITKLPVHADASYTLSTPFDVGRPEEPTMVLRRKTDDQKADLRITLEIQCPGRGGQADVEQRVGDGMVLINLVNGGPRH
ncbi:hypothetical protein LTR08_008816 [Meristemomyces frigidus]|nr:hypothetical protein LTR08_008816 [Meristemomyces frigidus]